MGLGSDAVPATSEIWWYFVILGISVDFLGYRSWFDPTWSTWWFTIWCVIGTVFFVGQAAYELRVNHPLEILWRGGGEAKGERTGWALAGHQEKSPELSHRRMATSSKKTLFEVLLKRGSKRLPNPFFLVPRLSGKQWFFSCPKGLEDPQNQQIETIQQKKIGQDAGMSLNGSFSGEMSIHSHELLNGEPGQGLMNTHGLDVLQIRIARRSGLGTSRSWWSHKVSGWRWLHVCRFDWEHIWPFQLIYA